MAAVLARLRAEVRTRWRATAALALLVGAVGGIVIAATAGARRTDSALPRLLAFNQPQTLDAQFVDASGQPAPIPPPDQLAKLPHVDGLSQTAYLLMTPAPAGPKNRLGSINPLVDIDGNTGRKVAKPVVLAGRRPRDDYPFEVSVSEGMAKRRQLKVGSTFSMQAYLPSEFERVVGNAFPDLPSGRVFTFSVVGIERQPYDIPTLPTDPDVIYLGQDDMYMTKAFWDQFQDEVATFGPSLLVRLQHGLADLPSFRKAVE